MSMPESTQESKTVAPLVNVHLCRAALRRAMERPDHLPGIITFYGPSGYGKTTAAIYTANKCRGYYIECLSTCTRSSTLQAILREMGIAPQQTLAQMTMQVATQLTLSGRPLIIDEVDHLANKGAIELIRDIHEVSKAAIVLIGEERLPNKLLRWERFHNRMLDWVAAEPSSIEDCKQLARLYSPDVQIDSDLLARINKASAGVTRRIAINIELVRAEARTNGLQRISAAEWGERRLFDGMPRPRSLH